MSKESYLRKLFRQVKESYNLPKDPEIKKALENPNTTRDQKREILGAARQKKVDNIARLSRPVENYLNRSGDDDQEQGPEFQEDTPEPGFNEDANDQNQELDDDQGQLNNLQQQVLKQEQPDANSENLSPREKAGALPKPAPELTKTAKATPPGGWLEKARGRLSRSPLAKTGARTAGSSSGGAARQAGKQIASQVSNAIKKAAVQAAKKLAMSIAANPYFWLIIGGILLAVILFALAFSLLNLDDSKHPSVRGKTPTIQVNPKTDWATISQVLKLAGDQSVTNESINDSLNNFSKYLIDIEKDIKDKNPANKDALIKQLTPTKESLILLKGTKSPANAKSFLSNLGKLSDLIEDNFPAYPNDAAHKTRIPVEGTIPSFNRDLHGSSFLHPEKITGSEANNVYTTDNARQEKCDAVDVGVPVPESSSVYPIFAGQITDISSDGTDSGKKITIRDGDYSAIYAHLIPNPDKNKGQRIEITEAIGTAKSNHIQIEVMYKGTCLVTTHADQIDHGMKDRRHEKWGGYLWDRIKTKFNLK